MNGQFSITAASRSPRAAKRRQGKGGILFVSTMSGYPWGGSEELWGRTALNLVERGLQISASVEAHSPAHARVREMAAHGVNVWQRPHWYSRKKNPLLWFLGRDPAKHEVLELIKRLSPTMVVFSSGTTTP